jgi:diguanylate cyclase (GGDEF)-like protein/PAS domain S-box-containing protein
MEEVLGYRSDELEGSDAFAYVHPEDASRAWATFVENLDRPGSHEPVQLRVRRKDGHWLRMEAAADNRLRDPEVKGVVVQLREAHQRPADRDDTEAGESGEPHRVLVERIPAVTYSVRLDDPDGPAVYVSPQAGRMFGYAREDWISEAGFWSKLIHPDDREWVKEAAAEARSREDEELPAIEYRMLAADGSVVWVRDQATITTEPDGVRLLRGVMFDVSEQKRILEQLNRNRERMQSAFENASIGVALIDLDERFIRVNPALCAMLGYPEAELVGTSPYQVTHPEDVEKTREYARRAREPAGRMGDLEKRYIHKDGSVVWVLSSIALAHDSQGAPGYYVCQYQDITGRKQAEEWLRLMESVTVNANDAVMISASWPFESPGPSVVYVNEAFTSMTGYEPEEVVGKTPRILQGPGTDRRELDKIRVALEAWQPVRAEVLNYCKDGTEFWVELNIVPVSDENGRITHWVSVQRDTTERKRAEEALQQSEQRYRAVVEEQAELICRYSPDTTLTFVNDAYCHYFGKSREELVGRSFMPLVLEEDRERAREHIERVIGEGVEKTYEGRVLAGGELRWQQWTDRVIRDAEGGIVEVQCVGRDVTDRRRAEEGLAKERNLLKTVIDSADDAVFVKDSDHRFRLNNSTHARWLGADGPRELLGKTNADYWGEERTVPHHADDRRVIEAGHRIIGKEEHISRADSEEGRWVSTTKVPLRDKDGEVEGLVAISRDVTEARRAKEELQKSERRFRSVVQDSAEVVKICDPDGTLRYASPAFERLFGYDTGEAVASGMNVHQFIHPEDLSKVLAATEEALEGGEGATVRAEYRFRCSDGSYRHVESVATFLIEDPAVEGVVINVRDVTERKRLEHELEYQALHDPLTGLPNRRLFTERLSHALSRAKGSRNAESGLAVMFLDLDDFKAVNDSLGHEAGDGLLVAVAERLGETLRPQDTVARLGGDEFVVLLEETGPERGSVVADRISRVLAAPFALGDPPDSYETSTTVSLGITFTSGAVHDTEHESGIAPEDLLKEADAALYRAKERGKAVVEIFEPAMAEQARQRLELRGELKRALERGEFSLRYQPIADLARNQIVGLEALVRWEHPERGVLPPVEFIPAAEESGLIVELGEWVLNEACSQAKSWSERHGGTPPPSWLSVNLSTRQLAFPRLIETVSRVLERAGMEPSALTLEITESATIGEAGMVSAQNVLEGLKSLGVKLAVDDFGTGYSSIGYLRRFPVDTVKIDRSIVNELGESDNPLGNPGSEAVISAIITLAHSLGEKVVAAGVKDTTQLELLKQLGCDLIQGDNFWPPCPAEEAFDLYLDTVNRQPDSMQSLRHQTDEKGFT